MPTYIKVLFNIDQFHCYCEIYTNAKIYMAINLLKYLILTISPSPLSSFKELLTYIKNNILI